MVNNNYRTELRLFVHNKGVRLMSCVINNGKILQVRKKSFFDTLFGKKSEPEQFLNNLTIEEMNDFVELPLFNSENGNFEHRNVKLVFRNWQNGEVFNPKELAGVRNGEIAQKIRSQEDTINNLQLFIIKLREDVKSIVDPATAVEFVSRIKPKLDSLNPYMNATTKTKN